MRRIGMAPAVAACLLLSGAGDARPMMRFASDGESGGDGAYVNLIVREIRVTPIRARAGDAVRIEMVVENRGDTSYDTTTAEIRANGRVVASRLFTQGPGEGQRISRESFVWDTRGAAPGEYRIRGEVFLWYDASEFDNFLDLEVPLTILPADTAATAAQPGGSAVSTDPRWRPERAGGKGSPPSSPGGY